MKYATRYRCKACGTGRFLPERPLNPTSLVRVGCKGCNRITAHKPV